jgi:hypothetical protein
MMIRSYFPSGANASDNPSCVVSRGNIGHAVVILPSLCVRRDITTDPRCTPDSESLHEDVLEFAKTLEKGVL